MEPESDFEGLCVIHPFRNQARKGSEDRPVEGFIAGQSQGTQTTV